MTGTAAAAISLRYVVRSAPDAWVLPEGTVPESVPHNTAARHLELLLLAWADRSDRPLRVARNLAVRWLEERPTIGIDPDVCLLEPPPEAADDLSSLCLWKPGHCPPRVCFEVVSRNHPHKDYSALQDRYAAIATEELFVFDPLLAGPKRFGGPFPLQLWRHDDAGVFERVHAGDQAAYSEVLGAWLVPEGRLLQIADDRAGTRCWLTGEERERAARIALEARVAELEARRERG